MKVQRILSRQVCWTGLGTLVFAMLAGCAAPQGIPSVPPTVAQRVAACENLQGQTIAGVTVTRTQRFGASATTGGTGLCKVSGTKAPFLDIEVVVPDNWSGRLFHQGGGGFDGVIRSALTFNNSGVLTEVHPTVSQKGAVYTSSNGGNRATIPEQAGPRVWATGSAEGKASADDYAYKALWTTVKFAKGITRVFFAQEPARTYFTGCSNGGRNGYIAAQRWPNEYDGIVSGCETMDMTGQTSAWTRFGRLSGTPAALTVEQYKSAYAAAVNACDANDGVQDGYLANPGACHFDPSQLQCGQSSANADPKLCLSAAQVGTLKMLLSDVKLTDGTLVYSRYNWSDFSSVGPRFGVLGSAYVMLATGNPLWLTPAQQASFDIDAMYTTVGFGLNRLGLDHDKAAIAAYVASGKKLISWHAAGDNLLSANDHVRNFTAMTQLVKGLGVDDPSVHARLFMAPTSTHGAAQSWKEVDWASAIIDWVENNKAPQQLTYTFTQAGATAPRSLPVCLSPQAPRYISGDAQRATSYACE